MSVVIEGATGQTEEINGAYEVTTEMCGGMPVFQNKTKGRWLEYFQSTWYVRPTSARGRCGHELTLYRPLPDTDLPPCIPSDHIYLKIVQRGRGRFTWNFLDYGYAFHR